MSFFFSNSAGDELPGYLADLDRSLRIAFQFRPLRLREREGHASGHRRHGVDRFAARFFRDALADLPRLDGRARQAFVRLHQAGDVPRLRRRAVQQEVRHGQEEQVQRVRADHLARDQQLTEVVGRLRYGRPEDLVDRLGRREMVHRRADAADARRDARRLFDGRALEELLEAPQLGGVEVGVGHFALVVQANGDLGVALYSRDWRDRDVFHR